MATNGDNCGEDWLPPVQAQQPLNRAQLPRRRVELVGFKINETIKVYRSLLKACICLASANLLPTLSEAVHRLEVLMLVSLTLEAEAEIRLKCRKAAKAWESKAEARESAAKVQESNTKSQKVKEQGNGKKMRVDKAMYHKEVEAEKKVAENNKVDKLLPMPLPVTHDVQKLNKIFWPSDQCEEGSSMDVQDATLCSANWRKLTTSTGFQLSVAPVISSSDRIKYCSLDVDTTSDSAYCNAVINQREPTQQNPALIDHPFAFDKDLFNAFSMPSSNGAIEKFSGLPSFDGVHLVDDDNVDMCALCPHDYPNNNDNSVDKGLHTDCEALQHGQMDLSVGTDSDSGIVHLLKFLLLAKDGIY
ncbi:hypothetical protein V8E53_008876 [Lactarius tabidus]